VSVVLSRLVFPILSFLSLAPSQMLIPSPIFILFSNGNKSLMASVSRKLPLI